MKGYDDTTYGEAFADVYDEWYQGISDADATADLVAEFAGPDGSVIELGAGTGRLALPMRDRGLRVTAVDVSAPMLDQLAAAASSDAGGRAAAKQAITIVRGDMVDDLPPGPYNVALVAYNTLFNLDDEQRQQACFEAVAARLVPGGRFVVEAFVPDEPFRSGSAVELRSMTVDTVVLSVSQYDPDGQHAEGHLIQLTEANGVKLRPWSIRYITVEQIDAMAAGAGFVLEHRWADVRRTPFTEDSSTHLSVYRLRPT